MDQKTENRLRAIEETLDELVVRIEKLEGRAEEEVREKEEEDE